ncbi:MAG: hypothetical protein WC498_00370 [Candidatus Saccharimonadales bacterium]
MKTNIASKFSALRRPVLTIVALVLSMSGALPALLGGTAYAGQVTTRSIQLSNSTPSATGTTYNVSFKPTATGTVGGIVVDFCSDSPIIGSTNCTAPAGMTIGASPSVTITSGLGVGGTWATTSSTANTLFYTNATPQAVTAGTSVIFTINAVTNTSATGSFYARVLTFDTAAHTTAQYTLAGATRASTFANELDYGGIALSTATAISITATVMETLSFCVSKVAPGVGCTGTSVPTLTLGHGSPLALDSSAVDTDTAYTQVSSNANSGVIVNLKTTSSVTCSGLSRDGGATCGIPGKGAFGTITAGTANFGLNVADGTGGTGTVSHNANYGTTVGSYGMGAAAPFSTYGDPIESSTGATANVNSLLTFAATAATTTPAGIYSTTESLIATGTF